MQDLIYRSNQYKSMKQQLKQIHDYMFIHENMQEPEALHDEPINDKQVIIIGLIMTTLYIIASLISK